MIAVDMSNPPPYVVTVVFEEGDKPIEVTWPFPTEEAALLATALAVGSGQFTKTVRKATKKKPAQTITLVSLWRRETVQTISGEMATVYVEADPVLVQP